MQEEIQPEPPAKKPEPDWDVLLGDFINADSSVKAAEAVKEKPKETGTGSVSQIGAMVAGAFDVGGVEAVKKLEDDLSGKATPLKEVSTAKPVKISSIKTAK